MRSASLFGFGRFATVTTLALGAGACAEGREPPAETAMVEIRSGLTFVFAERTDFCWAPNTSAEQRASCKEDGGRFALVPPPTSVALTPFAIDVHEVTNIQYLYCVAMGACSDIEGYNGATAEQRDYYDTDRFADYPMHRVTFDQAQKYCEFVDKRLPTEIEWERVARGNPDDGIDRPFPAEGIEQANDCQRNNGTGFAVVLCSGNQNFIPAEGSPTDFVLEGDQKIYGMFGNVSEWTDTWARADMGCIDDPPCPMQKDCDVTSEDYALCVTESKNCPLCGENECYYMCPGESRETIICTQNAGTVAQSAILPPGGTTRVVRGSNVRNSDNPCRMRSGRSNELSGTSALPASSGDTAVGFRCAKDL